jgi:hypothetical protein
MNKNRFRTIFSKRLGMLVAVEETATSQGKRPGEGAGADAGAADVEFGVVSIMKALAAALMATGATVSFAQSLPTNGQVAAGQASISQNANTMTINQGTQRTVINWDTFNVGEPLRGKSIVIWSEFGLGDEIFFLRFARMLREQCGAARVTVVCQRPLVNLFIAAGEADAVFDVNQTDRMPEHDFWTFPHALPVHLPLQLDGLPQSVRYLRVPEGTVQPALPGRPGALKVGIVFKGNPTHENDANRSLPSLSVMDDLFRIEGIDFYSLQKGAGADEAADHASRLANFYDVGAGVGSMDETAAAIAALDLVLTVDTSVAHVAGAMGKPTWLLLPFYGDWRWHYTREDSPWYPSMRLFRRRANCDWSEVMARVGGHLLQLKEDRMSHSTREQA